jgi:hypothetical protein
MRMLASGVAAVPTILVVLAFHSASAQQPSSPSEEMQQMMQQHEQQMMQMHGQTAEASGATTMPTTPGQDAFGAVQEIVGILEADPNTDWSKVNLEALRQHLIDMNAHQIDQTHLNDWTAKAETLPNGVVLTVTSDDPQQVQHLRGLGFIGVMVSGSHHQPHHLAMAKGELVHTH